MEALSAMFTAHEYIHRRNRMSVRQHERGCLLPLSRHYNVRPAMHAGRARNKLTSNTARSAR